MFSWLEVCLLNNNSHMLHLHALPSKWVLKMAAQPAPLTPTRGKHKCDWRQVDEAVVVKVSWEHDERLMESRWKNGRWFRMELLILGVFQRLFKASFCCQRGRGTLRWYEGGVEISAAFIIINSKRIIQGTAGCFRSCDCFQSLLMLL